MTKYRKIPMEIEAEEFTGQMIPNCTIIEDLSEKTYKVYNKLHESWIKLKVGDMVRTDLAPEDVYPIDRDTFELTYEKVE